MNDQHQTEIILKVDINDLRDIYFGERDHIYFFGPKTKGVSLGLIGAVIFCPIIMLYALHIKEGGLFFFAVMLLFTGIAPFWDAARPIIQWKKSVNEFIKIAEKVKDLRILYTDEYILHIQDGSETKLNWSVIERATITDRFIELHASTYIFLPKSSMTAEEYRLLSEKVMEKVQEVQKI